MAQVTQDALTPTYSASGTEVSVTLTVHSDAAFVADVLTVAVRDAGGAVLDFPGVYDIAIPPSGYTLTTAPKSFPAGSYTIFGAYAVDGGWYDLPSTAMVVGATDPTGSGVPTGPGAPVGAPGSPVPVGSVSSAAVGPTAGRTLTWAEEFTAPISTERWNSSTTSAYQYGSHNPAGDKLDWLRPANVTVAGGLATFTARPGSELLTSGQRAWDTGLLTTEGTPEAFQVQVGDYLETAVRLPSGLGAWPGLWTWRDGDNEIDTFEYHPDYPSRLEFTNQIRQRQHSYTNPAVVAPLGWVTVGTAYGLHSVNWYVNGSLVFADRSGVPAGWTAYPILNLSVNAGRYHPAPQSPDPLTFSADYLRVWH
ncbi:hypothetical protein P3T37_001582 [Kitasatospora sp. MAA4]|uniref:glycoside hydrolase family 16 protein n=1 Tax=Kitasatospora sp. MAA4 TaxID=3035093 RepID=UPI0024736907|nr:hypothetical protein [Kitasatospora sp. MAA4]MDH6132197.1 hypothetical protein [Kitasatospora sp. MAA4]